MAVERFEVRANFGRIEIAIDHFQRMILRHKVFKINGFGKYSLIMSKMSSSSADKKTAPDVVKTYCL